MTVAPVGPGETTYQVQPGDTIFYKIAPLYNTTVGAIAARNELANPNRIFPGQTLIVPSPNSQPSATVAAIKPNPYRDPGPWRHITIAGVDVPGVIVSVDGCRKPEEWSVQKGTSASNATTVWKGTKLAENIKIVTNLHNEAEFDAYEDLRAILRPKLGQKPPSLPIVHPIFAEAGVTRIACVDVAPRLPTAGLSWLGEIIVIEYNPSKSVNAGPAGAAKSGTTPGQNAQPTENEKLAAQAAALAGQAAAL